MRDGLPRGGSPRRNPVESLPAARDNERGKTNSMTPRETFLESGHLPTLVAALLYFDVSFMVWVLLGPLAPFLRDRFALTAAQQGLLVAIPLLGGSCFRPILGALGDRIGGRRAGLIGLSLT